MQYNFDQLVSRWDTHCVKWDFSKKQCEGEYIIPMSIADMDFETVPEVKKAIIQRANQGIYGYTKVNEGYYESIMNWMMKRHSWELKKDWIVVSSGVVPAINNIIKAFTHPGDKVVLQSPVYYPFYKAIVRNGCTIVNNPLKFVQGKYYMNFKDLEQKLKHPRVKLLILCSPHNPVGRVWTGEELRKLGEMCIKNNVLIVSDEIHSDLVYKNYKHIPLAAISNDIRENSIICTAPSKTFNLAGLQVSNIIIPKDKLRREYTIQLENAAASSINLFGMIACETAYKYGEGWLDQLIDYLYENKEVVKKYIGERIPKLKIVEPEGTYLLWIDCRELGMNGIELKNFMLTRAKIQFNEGFTFGKSGEGFERMNIACPRDILREALGRIEEAVNNL
ncbi:MalY/PatB family protein [Clostridium kluyveri]|uniref:cysteine-S-conjugate beta-lyase n=1 Tax=Clostridium kluyveri TaxID=1534 RepID=A0A1L5F5W9_CLOKL|nr:MalY/PatB family protein [Clostridium kluyveri]APM38411.1 cystathionine beta-lyase [Clostridium kluyveri]UZQ50694.1 pyridoxal phosphate-dependent aminotransferase [Clostridium kluyveri]